MPDFTIENYYACRTLLDGQTVQIPGRPYKLIWGTNRRGERQVQCTCQGFVHRGICKHVREHGPPDGLLCMWDQFVSGSQPVETPEGKRCPKCGGEITVVRHAV